MLYHIEASADYGYVTWLCKSSWLDRYQLLVANVQHNLWYENLVWVFVDPIGPIDDFSSVSCFW